MFLRLGLLRLFFQLLGHLGLFRLCWLGLLLLGLSLLFLLRLRFDLRLGFFALPAGDSDGPLFVVIIVIRRIIGLKGCFVGDPGFSEVADIIGEWESAFLFLFSEIDVNLRLLI